jgi:hypothetical protein
VVLLWSHLLLTSWSDIPGGLSIPHFNHALAGRLQPLDKVFGAHLQVDSLEGPAFDAVR